MRAFCYSPVTIPPAIQDKLGHCSEGESSPQSGRKNSRAGADSVPPAIAR